MKQRILFVCLGNICRSPAADAIFHKMTSERGLASQFEIDSAGTSAAHAGELPDPRMRRAGAERGYEMKHLSRQFRRDDYDRFDMIVVMDDTNYERVCRLAPDRESLGKVRRMADFCRKFDIRSVPDPYYNGDEGFRRVLDILEDGCLGLLAEVTEAN